MITDLKGGSSTVKGSRLLRMGTNASSIWQMELASVTCKRNGRIDKSENAFRKEQKGLAVLMTQRWVCT